MKSLKLFVPFILVITSLICLTSCTDVENEKTGNFLIGWSSVDLTPEERVVMTGGSRARTCNGVMDPITATALVLESVNEDDNTKEIVAQVSVDWGSIWGINELLTEKISDRVPQIDPGKIIINATHTHAAPEFRTLPHLVEMYKELGIDVPLEWSYWGIDLGVTPSPLDYLEFAAVRIADAVEQAWKNRKPGGVSFGLGHAVVGHNRITSYNDGRSKMYGNTDQADFSHIEGYEDHSVGLLYTYDISGNLTGILVNIACPAQVSEGGTLLTADYWHETRNELRDRLGESLYVLSQIAAAGDQSPHILVEERAIARMQKLMFGDSIKTGDRTLALRKDIAIRIADAVTSVLPYMKDHIDWDPILAHRMEEIDLTRRRVTEEEVENKGRQNFERLLPEYKRMRRELEEKPELKQKEGWSDKITPVYWHLSRAMRVIDRYELQYTDPTLSVPIHIFRIGNVVFATNPFELYLDYGIRIKARSKAVQTFIVEISNGYYRYLPTERSVEKGAYGAIPESNEVGPEGGNELVERTLELIDSLWEEQ
jgi:hypothetical protein